MNQLELKIRTDLVNYLQIRGWHVEITHGNMFQTGFPDLFLAHPKWGQRWIDVKQPKRYSFTKAQKIKWPIWDKYGIGIWILTAATQEQYNLLFKAPNWRDFWKASWAPPDIDRLLDEIQHDDTPMETRVVDVPTGGLCPRSRPSGRNIGKASRARR